MLILSQDKKEIVNLDNITNMFILNNTVKCMLTDGGEIYIGVYDTEERAKEVLQEIINEYKLQNYLVYDAETGSIKDVNKNIVFIMPEE